MPSRRRAVVPAAGSRGRSDKRDRAVVRDGRWQMADGKERDSDIRDSAGSVTGLLFVAKDKER